jgi:hypothetical protein
LASGNKSNLVQTQLRFSHNHVKDSSRKETHIFAVKCPRCQQQNTSAKGLFPHAIFRTFSSLFKNMRVSCLKTKPESFINHQIKASMSLQRVEVFEFSHLAMRTVHDIT